MVTEIIVKIKGESSNFSQKFLCYDQIVLDPSDNIIKQFINDAKANYKGEIDSIVLKAHLEVL
jgi:hypothetical protein